MIRRKSSKKSSSLNVHVVTLCGVSNVIFRSFSAIVLQHAGVNKYIRTYRSYKMYVKIYLYKIINLFI